MLVKFKHKSRRMVLTTRNFKLLKKKNGLLKPFLIKRGGISNKAFFKWTIDDAKLWNKRFPSLISPNITLVWHIKAGDKLQ